MTLLFWPWPVPPSPYHSILSPSSFFLCILVDSMLNCWKLESFFPGFLQEMQKIYLAYLHLHLAYPIPLL